MAALCRGEHKDVKMLYRIVHHKYYLWLLAIACVVFFSATFYYVSVGLTPSGDEPHFLIISQTLLKYHSLNVMADYAHGDYHSFYPLEIDAHVTKNAWGQLLPVHSIGGPILWLLPFWLLGRPGADCFISALCVLTVLNIYQCLCLLRIRAELAFWVSLLYVCASPLFIYAHMSFIEPIGSFICIFVFRKLLELDDPVYHTRVRSTVLLCSSLLALLPWVHIRMTSLVAILWALWLYRIYTNWHWQRWVLYIWATLPLCISALLLEVYSVIIWGSWNPAANQIYSGSKPFEVLPFKGMLGILFDRNFGLLVCFPLCFLLVGGIILAWRRQWRFYNVSILLLTVPYIIEFTSFRHWSGGWSPPARFMLVLLPLYAFYFAYTLQHLRAWLASAIIVLALIGGSTYNVLTLLTPYHGFNDEGRANRALTPLILGGRPLSSYLPSLTVIKWPLLLAWIGIYSLVTVGLVVCARQWRVDRERNAFEGVGYGDLCDETVYSVKNGGTL